MAEKMRDVLGSVSDTVFPGSRRLMQGDKANFIAIGNYLLSDLGLQLALYLNCYFSPCWFVVCIIMLNLKYSKVNQFYKFVLIVVYIVMACIELTRLYLGYSGNLQEKVPELAGFWLVTFILQLPLTCFLLFNEFAVILPIERAVNIIMLAFLLVEIFQGYKAIKRMTDAQVKKFHLRHLHDDIQMEELAEQVIEDVDVKKFN